MVSAVLLYPDGLLLPKTYYSHTSVKIKPAIITGSAEKKSESIPSITPSPLPTPQTQSLYKGIPVYVSIPKINLKAFVIEAGQTEDGGMEVPPDNKTVGWWKYGTKPGFKGSAVLAGHYRVKSGKPGIFFELSKVAVGDEISVSLDNGRVLTFVVSGVKDYSVEEFPLELFFNANDDKRLNLVTCAGSYIKEKDNYSHRRVVYSVLK